MLPWSKLTGPLGESKKEADEINKRVDQVVKESNKVISKKTAKDRDQKLRNMYKKCTDVKTLTQTLQTEVENLKEEDEPSKTKKYENRKRNEIERLSEMKTLLTKTMAKLLPNTNETEFLKAHTIPKKHIEEEDKEDEDEEEEESHLSVFKAMVDYAGEEDEDLSFKCGDVLTVLEKRDDGWWLAVNEEGDKGFIPKTFMKVISKKKAKDRDKKLQEIYQRGKAASEKEEEDHGEEDEEDEEEKEEEEKEEGEEEAVVTTNKSKKKSKGSKEKDKEMSKPKPSVLKAIVDYEGEEDGDLSFRSGDVLTVLEKRDDGWWLAENEAGNKGFVPKTFMKSQ